MSSEVDHSFGVERVYVPAWSGAQLLPVDVINILGGNIDVAIFYK